MRASLRPAPPPNLALRVVGAAVARCAPAFAAAVAGSKISATHAMDLAKSTAS